MASSPFSLNFLSSPALHFLFPHPHTRASENFRTLRLEICSSNQTVQLDTQEIKLTKKKRKPRPSFLDQIQEKWSVRTASLREKLPWEGRKQEQDRQIEGIESKSQQDSGAVGSDSEVDDNSAVSDPTKLSLRKRLNLAPWEHGSKPRNTHLGSEARNSRKNNQGDENGGGLFENFVHNLPSNVAPCDRGSKPRNTQLGFEARNSRKGDEEDKIAGGFYGDFEDNVPIITTEDNKENKVVSEINAAKIEVNEVDEGAILDMSDLGNFDQQSSRRELVRLPWERKKSHKKSLEGERPKNSNNNAKSAEKLIPEAELERLRKVALRMVERIKVGPAGVTQALVDSIHEKWELDEVVKLKFERPPAVNMKRTHEILESRTGGLVIWRSGSSVVLYRGMAYKLPCVQSYIEQYEANMNMSESSSHLSQVTPPPTTSSAKHLKNLSEKELVDLNELNFLLDELGPRFVDWSGPEPLPVDADLLPAVIPGYKPPFRLLPYGVRHALRDKEMTFFRRTARIMPPHFALGRNKELQGLAMAMVKLWERSAIAKIAIKRGVHNTHNERMAEELKMLTGGTLLSRNKEYIVFYRGNDFLSPRVTEAFVEAQNLTVVHQNEEEQARNRNAALIDPNALGGKGPLVAGTLAETVAATSRWANQPSREEIEKELRYSALARHASLVKFLERKLALAKGKVRMAEKALLKVQEHLEPTELPTDLETISDEERFLLRKIGLSMKPFLLLGRRGVYDGTIENIHLHWKYRELVKIIVGKKKYPQVRHIAIFLEAESGGVLVSIDKITKGYAIIIYRGKNYQRPRAMRPKNLLTKRQALARSIELQRREALKHHILELQEKIEKLKSELEDMKTVREIDQETLYARLDNASDDDNDMGEDESEEMNLQVYDSENEVST